MRNYRFFSSLRRSASAMRAFYDASPLRWLCALTIAALLSTLTTSFAFAQSNDLNPNSDFSYAEKLAQDGYVDLAVEQYKDFLSRFPGDARAAEAMRRIADGYAQLKKYAEARVYYEKLLLQHGTSPYAEDVIYQIGHCFESEEEPQKAAQQFERFAILHESLPLAADAFLRAGRLYLQAEERVRGRKLLFKVVENYRENEQALAEANYALINDFIAAGEYNRAFSVVNSYLQRFAEITATPRIWLVKAKLHEQLGQISETISTLESLRSRFPKSREAQQAGLALAELAFKLGDGTKAYTILAQIENSAGSDSIAVAAALLEARLQIDEQKFADAAASLQGVATTRNLTAGQRVRLAELFDAARDYQNAIAHYEMASKTISPQNDSLRSRVALKLARASFQLGNGAKALEAIRRVEQEHLPASLAAESKFLLANLFFELYEDPARASRHYAEFVESFPEHQKVDDAQANLARCYEALQQWNLAQAEWRRLQQNYPASSHYQTAAQHIELLQHYFSPDYVSLVESAIANLGQNGAGLDGTLRQAEIYFRFRQFHKAIPLLKTAIASEENSAVRARAMYLLGNCYYALADIAYVERRDQATALFDSANVLLKHVRKQYADQSNAEELDVRLAEIALKKGTASFATLDSISQAYFSDERFFRIHNHVLPMLLPTVVRQDSTAKSHFLRRVAALNSFGNWQMSNRSNYLMAQFAILQHDTTRAMASLEKIVNGELQDPVRAQAELLYAKLQAATGQINAAIDRLEALHYRHHYSTYADSALYYLASYSYKSGELDRAIRYLQRLRERRLNQATQQASTVLWSEATYLEAEILKQSSRHFEAIRAYLTYLQNNPSSARASQALIALGQLAEKFYAMSLAKSYYADVIELYPQRSDAVNAAKMRLVDLEFRLGNYQVARTQALEALQANLSFTDEMAMTKMAIIAKLRQNEAQNAESEMKNFKHKFDDDNQAYAEIQYEYGDYHIRQKNFRQADKTFKNLGDKFKGTDYGIQGEFGYGKSLLYQAKTEDALEVLTEIPRKYPDHPFLRVVFLNLGDFYLDQQQWGNAIQAFNSVLADSVHDQYQKAALAKMSELYQSTGMYDACMVYTRKYIEQYPQEENIMLFKMRIGSLLRELKQFDDAVAHYREILPLASGENAVEIQYYIGDSYFEARKYELAIAEFLKLRYAKLNTKLPWRVTAVYKAGEAYMRLNNYERAREMYDFVVRSEGVNSQLGNFAYRKISQIDEMLKSMPRDATKG